VGMDTDTATIIKKRPKDRTPTNFKVRMWCGQIT
jgi:hypothetical protein